MMKEYIQTNAQRLDQVSFPIDNLISRFILNLHLIQLIHTFGRTKNQSKLGWLRILFTVSPPCLDFLRFLKIREMLFRDSQ